MPVQEHQMVTMKIGKDYTAKKFVISLVDLFFIIPKTIFTSRMLSLWITMICTSWICPRVFEPFV